MADTLTIAVKKMLEKEGIEPSSSGDPPALGFSVQGDAGEWACFVRIDEEREVIAFYSLCPLTAEPKHRAAVHEFLTRANWGLALGNFELDLDDGEIRVKTSMDLEGTKPTAAVLTALLKKLLYSNVAVMDLFLPGIALVLSGKGVAEAMAVLDG
jgi:hypothetical protein